MKILIIGKRGRAEVYTADQRVFAENEIVYAEGGASTEEILNVGKDAEAIIIDPVSELTGEAIRQMPKLKLIHSEGVGFNCIDLQAANEKKVYVCNCKGMNANAVAEQTILLMLGLLRDIAGGDRAVRAGRQVEVKEGMMLSGQLKELSDCKVGLIGFGDIAKSTAWFLKAFGAKVVYNKPIRVSADEEARYGVSYMDMDELLRECDIVSLHLPLNRQTEKMADESFFAKMKEGAYLINTSRGALIDTQSMLGALRSGKLAGAGLDTLEGEPVTCDNPILQGEPEVEEKLLLSCHIGGVSGTAFRRGYATIWSNIEKTARGEVPDNVVNLR